MPNDPIPTTISFAPDIGSVSTILLLLIMQKMSNGWGVALYRPFFFKRNFQFSIKIKLLIINYQSLSIPELREMRIVKKLMRKLQNFQYA